MQSIDLTRLLQKQCLINFLKSLEGCRHHKLVSVVIYPKLSALTLVCLTGKCAKFVKCWIQCPLYTRVEPPDAPPSDAHALAPNRFHPGPGPVFLKRERCNLSEYLLEWAQYRLASTQPR